MEYTNCSSLDTGRAVIHGQNEPILEEVNPDEVNISAEQV